MNFYPQYLRDVFNNYYIGLSIPEYEIEPFLNDLKDILGEDDYETYTKLQQDRDHGKFHITLINVMDYERLMKTMGIDTFVNSLDSIFKYEIDDVKFLGMGTATKGTNQTYFIVVKSDKLKDIRDRYNLPEHDFHVTIGYKFKDVFGVPKNTVMKKENIEFLKNLKNLYYTNNEKFDFLKKIQSFAYDKDEPIVAIEIRKSSAVFRSGNSNYFTVSIINGKLHISAEWQDQKNKSWLATTQISQIFKK